MNYATKVMAIANIVYRTYNLLANQSVGVKSTDIVNKLNIYNSLCYGNYKNIATIQ